jgi:hypothetical protein
MNGCVKLRMEPCKELKKEWTGLKKGGRKEVSAEKTGWSDHERRDGKGRE